MISKTICLSAVTLLVAMSLTACKEEKVAQPLDVQTESAVAFVEGEAGRIERQVTSLTAWVKSIDTEARTITLDDHKGGVKTIDVPQEATNFDQIKVGDKVRMKLVEEMIAVLSDADAVPTKSDAASVAAKAAEGEKPGMAVAQQALLSAKVVAVDTENHTATLKFESGDEKTVTVRDDVKIDDSYIGREVLIRLTQAMAISIEEVTPAEK